MARHNFFNRFAKAVSKKAGHASVFVTAFGIIVLWAVLGPVFGFSDTWQLIINTGTTIITFLMVFLIQHTQNCDSEALHLKLDEILRSYPEASNRFLNLEELSEEELDEIRQQFLRLAEEAKQEQESRENSEVKIH